MSKTTVCFALLLLTTATLLADPCGMVPPIYTGEGPPITRIGEQQTYVFYKDGIETFVIRPGFSGKVEDFGMLIPFPNPPAVRKVPDNIFAHVGAAVDPPEVVIDLRVRYAFGFGGAVNGGVKALNRPSSALAIEKDEVRVVRQEAVGMYEVAVLEAGSSAALKKWLDDHAYKYPAGMEKPVQEYVKDRWCFVAVKTKVGEKKSADPKPGQRTAKTGLPAGSTFDGYVQAMGFRFKSDELVVPMRLSAFNEGELRNIVYILTDSPKKIRAIPEEYVVRQLSGKQLLANVTEPLPLRIIGGTETDIPDYRRKGLPAERNPAPHNGSAKELFASDLLAIRTGELSLQHEEQEKQLLAIGERFGLRGAAIDKVNANAMVKAREKTVAKGIADVEKMTLTVVDGDFPRAVLASRNLTFGEYRMPKARNNTEHYNATSHGPAAKREGILKIGALEFNAKPQRRVSRTFSIWPLIAGLAALVVGFAFVLRSKARLVFSVIFCLAIFSVTAQSYAQESSATLKARILELESTVSQLKAKLTQYDCEPDQQEREETRIVVQATSAPNSQLQIASTRFKHGESVKAGDILATLDDSAWKVAHAEQAVKVHVAMAALGELKAAYKVAEFESLFQQNAANKQVELAKLRLQEFEEGVRSAKTAGLKSAIQIGELELALAKQKLEQGEVNGLQVKRKQIELETLKSELLVYERFTAPRMLKEFTVALEDARRSLESTKMKAEMRIKSHNAAFEAGQQQVEIEQQRLKRIEDQIALCRIVAPHAGVLRQATRVPFRAGLTVRKGQVLCVLVKE